MKHFFLFFSICFSPFVFSQQFVPVEPDTTLIRELEEECQYMHTRGFLYLQHYYAKVGERDSVDYIENTPGPPCAYRQEFEGGIYFSTRNCMEEGGGEEWIRFPKMDLSTAQDLINTLFYDNDNEWLSETRFAPDGAGCSYSILQKEDCTVIHYYCGC
ncbi:hypothetical protein [Phaeocystidibacter marisrubri]|uniref:Uncharacterized protein n=1 Tax=Phaeocystidibacter marisrubri TaxID=1577780 RepID=A0A6L3ZL33_9FLAO|nr:hypothetical protein [Phaeocystidibacter marisrubri]KAB2817850.1 hypothetical protein F8C82_05455 [Phaeocystidibacter marisrubri]